MARGMVSDMPMVRGLGPREDPTGMEVVLKVTLLLLSDRDMKDAGLDRPETGREGICHQETTMYRLPLKKPNIHRNISSDIHLKYNVESIHRDISSVIHLELCKE